MSKQANHVMVRIPVALKSRLDRLATEMLASYEKGNGYSDITLAEQGIKGTWVPLHAVISRALDELEGHRARSNRKRIKRQGSAQIVVSVEGCIHPNC